MRRNNKHNDGGRRLVDDDDDDDDNNSGSCNEQDIETLLSVFSTQGLEREHASIIPLHNTFSLFLFLSFFYLYFYFQDKQ